MEATIWFLHLKELIAASFITLFSGVSLADTGKTELTGEGNGLKWTEADFLVKNGIVVAFPTIKTASFIAIYDNGKN